MALQAAHRRGRVDAARPAAVRGRPPRPERLTHDIPQHDIPEHDIPGHEADAGSALARGYRARLVVILGTLSAFAPLSIDMYLPAFPTMAQDLSTSTSRVQLTLTGCLLGLAIGQLVSGALSDRLGRRRPLLAGLALYIVASLLCAAAPTVEVLAAARLLQGAAGAAGIVMSRAIVRDLYTGVPAVRFFARLMLVNGIAPVVAPSVGGLVLHVTSWRGVFVVLAGIGVVVLAGCALGLRESHPPERRRSGGFREVVSGFGELLRHRSFVGHALGIGLSLGAMFAYIAGASFALQQIYGLTPQQFALSFGLNALGIGAAGQVSGRLAGRVSSRRMLLAGVGAMTAGAAALLVVVLADASLTWFLAALFATVTGVGLIIPNATALALADHPHLAGSASSLLGLAQFGTGAVAAPIAGLARAGSAVPMAVTMLVLATGGLLAVTVVARPPAA